MKSLDVLAMGEPMLEFSKVERGGETLFLPGYGGDTSNAAVSAARNGAKAAYFTALGDDPFGRQILGLWEREGVDASTVIRRPGAHTGIYFISHDGEGHHFSYLRAGSAASLVSPGEVPAAPVAAARRLQVSAKSQAISDSACDAVFHALKVAREAGTAVCYDTNLRLRLWPLERARAIVHAAVAMSDIARPGLDDARQLTGLHSPEEICRFYLSLGCRIVALTMGVDGAMVATPGETRVIPAHKVAAVDATGAGDAFDGAFLAQWLRSGDPFASANYANAAAALSTLGYGAVAPLPRRADVAAFLAAG